MTQREDVAPSNRPPLSFGIFDWLDRGQLDLAESYEQRLKMLEYADGAGFAIYHLAEHHGTPLGMAPSPGIFLAAAAQRTRRIRLGPLVYVLPLYNPIRLMQEICMLDHLSHGRLEVGVGRGVVPYELANYNVDAQESRDIFEEALAIVTMGLATGRVSYEGRYHSVRDVQVLLRPFQRPYPPLWYPTDNPESITWVAEHGFSTISHYWPLEETRRYFDAYKRICQSHKGEAQRYNGHVAEPKCGIIRHVYVAESDGQALREAKAAFADFFSNFNYLHAQHGSTRWEHLADFEGGLSKGLHIVGAPATVRQRLKEQVEATGCNYFVGTFAFATLRTPQILSSLRLFAEEVMPAFRSAS